MSSAYWEEMVLESPETAGVAGIGGGGLSEILYRHHEEVAHLRRIVSFTGVETLVELGCGTGRWIEALAGSVRSYIGVDFSAGSLALARARVQTRSLRNVTLVQSSALEFEPPGPIDVLYLSGVTQYLEDAELAALLSRLAPHLAPGAVVIDRSTLHRRHRKVTDSKGYYSIYRTGDELMRAFAGAGLRCFYREPSYVFLSFPFPIPLLLRTRVAARCISSTSPVSFPVLRAAAACVRRVIGPLGETVEFTHDFSLFRPD